ncbi:MAG: LytTR family DNA-binding domain-containing protein, partial [Planctomycetes bacterium]|nr:LytTR family DNA-binding domain-containing protein [Planctomycetota bacterium]
ILIVDDEAPARERLRQLIEDVDEHEVVGEAGNGKEAIDLVTQQNPDVVLLDIRMPGVDGIETAHHLNAMEVPPAVVFTTAYDEYAIDAFDARAIGYVLKPVRRERLERALEHAARITGQTLKQLSESADFGGQRRHVCTREHGQLRLIPITEIRYFYADQKYVTVHHTGGESLIDDALKGLEEEFADDFVRIHRNALVALDQIDRLRKADDGKTVVVLRDGDQGGNELIVSRRHQADVRRRLKGK